MEPGSNGPVTKPTSHRPDVGLRFATMPASLAELLEVHAERPVFVILLQFVPGGFPAAVSGFATEHASERGFHAGGDLVVVLAAGDALDETAVLVPVGVDQVVGEGAVGGEFRRLGRLLLRAFR